jgi:dTMP kinase
LAVDAQPGSSKRGTFIVLEGPDGAGKSSVAGALLVHLRGAGHAVTATREPGGTRLGELVREVLLDRGAIQHVPEADALLFNAARAQLVREVVGPALLRGDIVLCDRFAPSTRAYQGYGGGLDLESLGDLERYATAGLEPDLVVLLDAPVSVGLARRGLGDPAQLTRFEDTDRHDAAFHERVRSGYRSMAAADPVRWQVVDADRPAEAVAADVVTLVDAFLASRAAPSEPNGALARMTA